MVILIKIGELTSTVDGVGIDKFIAVGAETTVDLKVPNYIEGVGNGNYMMPSETAWIDFLNYTGLHHLMYNKSYSLMREACVPITEEHRSLFYAQYNKYRKEYPDARPDVTSVDMVDYCLAKLEWIRFWIDWSIANCKIPVFYNS